MSKNRKPNKVHQYTCDHCGQEFELSRIPNPGKGGLCKRCRRIQYEKDFLESNGKTIYEKYAKHNPKYKAKRREWHLGQYGLTQKDYNYFLELQGGVCAICKSSYSGHPRHQHLAVDHDHLTGKVRGLLCHKCNRMLGHVKDNFETLNSAVGYLIRNDPSRSWDHYFMRIAEVVATRSKDPSTQVGAVLVRERHILATGYNGLPRGVNDSVPERWARPLKYQWICHAEENCLVQCSYHGVAAQGGTLYVTPLLPCTRCAVAIVGSGIKEVVVPSAPLQNPRWQEENEEAIAIFNAAKVLLRPPE